MCQGPLTKERDVRIHKVGSITAWLPLAWVCKQCGAAWPIALTQGGILKEQKQLWQDGKRAE